MKSLRRLALGLGLLLVVACLPKTIPPLQPQPAKVAVVLGAGVSRGFAHVGVLKVLEAHKVPIHLIVGTSAGSFVGSIYASGIDAFHVQKMALAIQKDEVVDLTIPDNGFIRGEKLESFVNKAVQNVVIERLKIHFRAVATNVQTGEEVVFAMGNTGKAVRASCSIPGVFQPVRIGDKAYVDGGLVSHINSSDFDRRHEAILEGEKAAAEALPKILQIMNKLRQEGRLT